jgi:hypothetical protein
MAVVYMQVKPKTEERRHKGQRFIVTYDPHAPSDARWVWRAFVTVTYEYVGNGNTIESAARKAKARISNAMRASDGG